MRLVRRLLVADELGNATCRDVQPVDGHTWARKDLWLESSEVDAARLCVWARCPQKDGILILEINGHDIARPPAAYTGQPPSPSSRERPCWYSAWQPVDVPPDWLHQGLNAVILRSEDGSTWELLIDSCRGPNRSAVSLDGGQTWDYDHLGYNRCYDGEFLVRLELERYPNRGRSRSEVFDLAAPRAETPWGPRSAFNGYACR